MVVVLANERVRVVLREAQAEGSVRRTENVETVSHKCLANAIRKCANGPSLTSLLAASQVYLTHEHACEVHIPRVRNPELQARIERLEALQKDREYARMVRDVSRADATNVEIESARMGKFAPQMSIGVNVVVTMATCFTAGFFVFKHSTGSQTGGLIGGVAAMIIAMGVEVVLVLTRIYTIDKEVDRHVKRRQKKADPARTLS